MSIELKPCPFCGNKEVIFYKFDDLEDEPAVDGSGFIWCHKCDFSSDTFISEKVAAEKWNRRATVHD